MNADDIHAPADDPRPAPPRRYRAIQRVEGPLAHLVGLSCRDFARLTVARLDRPLSVQENLRLRLHGAMCGLCTRFAAQFSVLGELIQEIETEPSPDSAPSPDQALIERIQSSVRSSVQNDR